jgi:Lsr2
MWSAVKSWLGCAGRCNRHRKRHRRLAAPTGATPDLHRRSPVAVGHGVSGAQDMARTGQPGGGQRTRRCRWAGSTRSTPPTDFAASARPTGAEIKQYEGETVTFSLDRASLRIDLSKANAGKLRDELAPFVNAARKAGGDGRRRRGAGRAGTPTLTPEVASASSPSPYWLETPQARRERLGGRGTTESRGTGCRVPCGSKAPAQSGSVQPRQLVRVIQPFRSQRNR